MQLKWDNLFEADRGARSLYRRWRETGADADGIRWLKDEKRSGRTPAQALLIHAPADRAVDNIRSDAVKGASDAMHLTAWANWAEEEGGPGLQPGPIEDQAPPTTRKAQRSGKAFIRRLEQGNRATINQMYWAALQMPGRHLRKPTPELFGHYLAMESMGHGVAWSDDHPDPEFDTPAWEYYGAN